MQTYHIYAIISMCFAGLTSVLAKSGLKSVSGDTGLAIRTSVVFILVWLNAMAFRHVPQMKNLSLNDILFLALSGITTSLSWIFYYKAIKIGNVTDVALIDKGSIIITLLLSFLILKEPITWKTLLGMVLVLSGVYVITLK